jgi:hypothetical protein
MARIGGSMASSAVAMLAVLLGGAPAIGGPPEDVTASTRGQDVIARTRQLLAEQGLRRTPAEMKALSYTLPTGRAVVVVVDASADAPTLLPDGGFEANTPAAPVPLAPATDTGGAVVAADVSPPPVQVSGGWRWAWDTSHTVWDYDDDLPMAYLQEVVTLYKYDAPCGCDDCFDYFSLVRSGSAGRYSGLDFTYLEHATLWEYVSSGRSGLTWVSNGWKPDGDIHPNCSSSYSATIGVGPASITLPFGILCSGWYDYSPGNPDKPYYASAGSHQIRYNAGDDRCYDAPLGSVVAVRVPNGGWPVWTYGWDIQGFYNFWVDCS